MKTLNVKRNPSLMKGVSSCSLLDHFYQLSPSLPGEVLCVVTDDLHVACLLYTSDAADE